MLKISIYNSDGTIKQQSIQGGSQWIEDDVSSQANGSNLVFILTNPAVSNTVEVFLNGLKQLNGADFTVTDSKTITFTTAPLNGDTVIIKYVIAG